MKRKIFAILMALTLVLTYMPALAFAEGGAVSKAEAKKAAAAKTVETGNPEKAKGGKLLESKKEMSVKAADYDDEEYYNGTYSGKPEFYTADYTDDDGELMYYYDIEPNSGDRVTVEVEDETFTYVWTQDDDGDWYFEIPGNPDDWLMIDEVYVNDDQTEAGMLVYRKVWDDVEEEYLTDWSAVIFVDKFSVSNTVKSISFQPSTIYLVAEDIICYDEGIPYYSFLERSTHKAGGETWKSPYAVGDKLTVQYVNGITQTFVDADMSFVDYDEEDEAYYTYYNDWFKKGDNYIRAYVDDDVLTLGNNTVSISWHGVTAKINVVVETAAQKKAKDDAARKAAAEKAAAARRAAAEKARIAAEFAANGYGYIDPSLPKVKFQKPKAAKKNFTAKWKKMGKKDLKKIKGIEVEYSLTPDFKNPVFKSTGKKKANVKIKKLASKKTYYVRAHSYVIRNGVKYVSYWSTPKKVKIK